MKTVSLAALEGGWITELTPEQLVPSILTLTAAVRAMRGLDGPLNWLVDEYPGAIRAMPTEHYEKLRAAHLALQNIDFGDDDDK